MFSAVVLAGLIASLAMMGIMQLITYAGIANGDMIRAVGSLFTKQLKGSFGIGLAIYLLFGILFSWLYLSILSAIPQQRPEILLLIATLGGFVHGLLIGFALVSEIVGRHPVDRFQTTGYSVALAHIVGHVVFGFAIGVSYLNFNGLLSELTSTAFASTGFIFTGVALSIGLAFIVFNAVKNAPRSEQVAAKDSI
ncbi:hypothetical protein [Pseudobacteriovorax antillogorgiicola]|uniref:Uncharacterized protein n=1 Tax=Pseudobacteriovorax antillogorgiicola TaxID=1513793 RepID=A0A1Y6BD79_9BACT|nr:hypothetical protein [Pseudobacteriovorax antillogorgiicola]TCS57283.1 hypothetical protein EDD56_10323 [Pseudobacteriovorax antillogorgiicola]SMF03093.1 hypothetical protein SAMN06296036_103310 [Pseudobacteriovorax antillogorgiicola]